MSDEYDLEVEKEADEFIENSIERYSIELKSSKHPEKVDMQPYINDLRAKFGSKLLPKVLEKKIIELEDGLILSFEPVEFFL